MIIVGKFLKSHGIKGHIKVKSFLTKENDLKTFKKFFVDKKKIELSFIQKLNKHNICSVNNCKSIEEVNFFLNKFLCIEKKELPSLNKNTFYFHELEGLIVIIENKVIGEVISLKNHGAGDYFQIKLKENKDDLLVPFNKHHVVEVNIKKKIISLNPKYYKNEI